MPEIINTDIINKIAESIAGVEQGRGICYGIASVVTALNLRGVSVGDIREKFEMLNRLVVNAGKIDIQKYDDSGLLDRVLKDTGLVGDKGEIKAEIEEAMKSGQALKPDSQRFLLALRLQAEKDHIQRRIRTLMVDKILGNDAMIAGFCSAEDETQAVNKLLESMKEDTFDINQFDEQLFDEQLFEEQSVDYKVHRLLVKARMTYKEEIKSLINNLEKIS